MQHLAKLLWPFARPHRMRRIQRGGLLLPMFRCLCVRVCICLSWAKTAELTEISFRVWTVVGPSEGQHLPEEKGQFGSTPAMRPFVKILWTLVVMLSSSTDVQPWFGPHCDECSRPGRRTLLPSHTSYIFSMCYSHTSNTYLAQLPCAQLWQTYN